VLNAELIEQIDVTPDTVVTLTTGQKLMVRETADEVIDRATRYRRSIFEGIFSCPWAAAREKERTQS